MGKFKMIIPGIMLLVGLSIFGIGTIEAGKSMEENTHESPISVVDEEDFEQETDMTEFEGKLEDITA